MAQQTSIHVNCFKGQGMTYFMPSYLKNAYCGRGAWGNSLSLRGLSYLISSFLKDIKHLPKTSKGTLFLSPSDVYVRSFPYIYYILIKDCYTKSSK